MAKTLTFPQKTQFVAYSKAETSIGFIYFFADRLSITLSGCMDFQLKGEYLGLLSLELVDRIIQITWNVENLGVETVVYPFPAETEVTQ